MITKEINKKISPPEAMSREIVVSLLCDMLENKKISYAFVNGLTEKYASGSKNIDVIIHKKHFGRVSNFFYENCNNKNLRLVQLNKNEPFLSTFILLYDGNNGSRFNFIKVNIFSDFGKNGRTILSTAELLNNKRYDHQYKYWKLNEDYTFLIYLLNAVESKYVNQDQASVLFMYWDTNKANISEGSKRFFNDDCLALIHKCLDEKNTDLLNKSLTPLSINVGENTSQKIKRKILGNLLLIKSAIKPSGLVVGVLGRDGSGKDTFINELSGQIGPFFNNIALFKKCPALLYKSALFNKNEGYHFSKPHQYVERGYIASFLKLNLLLIEFMFGYWLKVFPHKMKSNLVFYNRYFIDVLADPMRYRIKGNRFYIKLIHYILPKPDIWIILDLPSDILLKRKQELTFEMSEKLRTEYLNLKNLLPNSIVINNGGPLESSVNDATSFIINYMQSRISKHHR